MNILGIYGSFEWDANRSFDEHGQMTWVHDSGATLFIQGKHICSILEERLTRIKYEGNFPIHSIDYCLKEGNIAYEDIDEVYIPSMCLEIFYQQLNDGIVADKIRKLFPNAKFQIISHHLSHAASSVFTSNFEEGSIITLDGAGSLIYNSEYKNFLQPETHTIGYFNKKNNIFRIFNGIYGTNNFGSYYHSNAHKIYCDKINKDIDALEEKYRETWDGKIMGLSAYGHTKRVENLKDYTTSKDLSYNEVPYIIFEPKNFHLKNPDEKAYILQKNFEEALLYYMSELRRLNYLEENICLSGGSFLNVLGNSILKKNKFNIHIPPCTNDCGLNFGAACFGVFQNKQKISLPQNIALLGKKYSEKEIEKELKNFNLYYEQYENFEELCEFVAKELNKNKIIGWFQNKSEFGPRALGSRSLLMNPRPKSNKDIMNLRVKHREKWRPFAGIILEEFLNDYFEEDFISPYMLYSFTVKKNKREEISAITHVDYTCRVQTTNEQLYPEITTLIKKFKEISKIPLLLNTSFNDNGEPIVDTPNDAVKAFLNLDIDYLVINNFLIEKKKNKYYNKNFSINWS
jgi:carbamoyltransferase